MYVEIKRSMIDIAVHPIGIDNYTIQRFDEPNWVNLGSFGGVGEKVYYYEALTLSDSSYQDSGITFTSKYIKNTPLIIKAIAKPGYEFVAWENISDSSSISINCENDYNLTAVFQLSNDVVLSSVIDQSTTLISSQNYVVENDLIISNNGRFIIIPNPTKRP